MWGLLAGIGEFIFGLFQSAIDAVVAALVVAVQIAQIAILNLWNAIKIAGVTLMGGFLKVWDFFKPLYEDVLKPAWTKFWGWFDTARKWLNDTFGPVLQFLRDVRQTLLDFWKAYIQPWLDLIDVTRKGLRVLASLGVKWAAALDQELADLENKIQAPFLYLLGKLNEVINAVNLVVGADGLLQRVALIRSLARDYSFAWKAITQPYIDGAPALTPGDTSWFNSPKTLQQVTAETVTYLQGGDTPNAALIDEAAAQARIDLNS